MATKDPICGMEVDEKTAEAKGLVATKGGKKYYFCSDHCKNKFVEDKDGKNSKSDDDMKTVSSGKVKWYQSETFGKVFPWFLAIVLIGGAIWAYFGDFMIIYMGIFFILFSLMKMLDWKGFVNAFSKYDLIAKNVKVYGLLYPGIEFVLGILYLTNTFIIGAAWITIFIMGIGSIGVGKNIFSKNKFQCACLGTKINVPLTKVTFLEDIIMVIMAISLLI